MALPHSWPRNQACSTAAARSSQGIVDGRAGLQHHHRARVGRRDRRDQRVLLARQVHVRAVEAFALPFAAGADKDQRHVGLRGQVGGAGRCSRRDGRRRAEPQPGHQARLLLAVLDDQCDRLPGGEGPLGGLLGAARPEKRVAGRLRGPLVNRLRAVDQQAAQPGGEQAEGVGPALLRREHGR